MARASDSGGSGSWIALAPELVEHLSSVHDVDQRPGDGSRLEAAKALRAVIGQSHGLGVEALSMTTQQWLLIAM